MGCGIQRSPGDIMSESLLSSSTNNGVASVKSKYCPVSEIISSSQHFSFFAMSVEILVCVY